MKHYIIVLIVMFTAPTITFAFTSDDALHPVAHGAGSYAITHMGKVVCTKVSSLSTFQCSLIGASAALLAGALVEVTQEQTNKNALKGMSYDVVGSGLAIGFINWEF